MPLLNGGEEHGNVCGGVRAKDKVINPGNTT